MPISGTKRKQRVDENITALDIKLSKEELKRISDAAPAGAGPGTRYPADAMSVFTSRSMHISGFASDAARLGRRDVQVYLG